MDKITDELDVWGCDTKGALNRLLGDTGLYHECLMLFAEDRCFINLDLCLDKGDIGGAYEACHTLKGVAGNLGITPLFLSLSLLSLPNLISQSILLLTLFLLLLSFCR